MADLVTTNVTALRPARYAPPERIDGTILLDTIERCYFGFRRRRRDVGQATSCECSACVRIPDLNRTFVVHFGQPTRQRMTGRDELMG